MNIAFVTFQADGTTRTRCSLTPEDRAGFASKLASGETLESFLYESPPGPDMPCGPSGAEWQRLCEFLRGDPELQAAVEQALAASRHRFLAGH